MFGSVKQLIPRAFCCNLGAIGTPVGQEQTLMANLAQNCSAYPQPNVTQVQHCPGDFRPRGCPLLQISFCQHVQGVLFALEELEEIEVCLRPVIDAGRRAYREDVFAFARANLEEP